MKRPAAAEGLVAIGWPGLEAVIFVGIQASGKTTFYRERFFETHIRLSLDMLKTRHREKLLLEACIRAKQPFVLDNTNVLRQNRAEYILRARAGGFHVVGYFFEPQVKRSIVWNRQRSGKAAVPVKGLIGTLKRIERPRPEEGFDHLYNVRVDHAGKFVVKDWEGP